MQVAALAARLAAGLSAAPPPEAPPSVLSRVTKVVRLLEQEPGMPWDLQTLAQSARLSPYHFLRVFQAVTGTTPHQYTLRTRLRNAALRLQSGFAKILDIALDAGFQDASHFHHAFRAEFGQSPRQFRQCR
ncbi:MAG TPA: helix-turn-helix transcriptional regulator [Bryobacteraceae bacterium]|nr:helix-turn-helix transcriptional regulator [Bryobacteraceae bacterium]